MNFDLYAPPSISIALFYFVPYKVVGFCVFFEFDSDYPFSCLCGGFPGALPGQECHCICNGWAHLSSFLWQLFFPHICHKQCIMQTITVRQTGYHPITENYKVINTRRRFYDIRLICRRGDRRTFIRFCTGMLLFSLMQCIWCG